VAQLLILNKKFVFSLSINEVKTQKHSLLLYFGVDGMQS